MAKEISLPIIAPIQSWTARSYVIGAQVNYNGVDYISNSATISTDVPGLSTKWKERLVVDSKTRFEIIDLEDGNLTVEDEDGNIGMKLDINGKLIVSNFQIADAEFTITQSDDVIFGVSDAETALLFYLDTQFRLNAKGLVTNELLLSSEGKTDFLGGVRLASGVYSDYYMLISYGQSNSIGGGGGGVTLGEVYDSLTTTDGERNGVGAFRDYYYASGLTTPMLGIFNTFIDLVKSKLFLNYTDKGFQFIGVSPGLGGTTAANLSQGTAPYIKLLSNVTAAVDKATLQNKTVNVPFIGWTQGENEVDDDTTYEAYLATIEQLIIDLNTDVKAITLQKQDIPLISYQIAKHKSKADYDKVSLSQIYMGLTNDLFVVACPSYQFDYIIEDSSGGAGGFIVHFTPEARLQYGAYLAIAAYKTLVEGQKFKPLHIENAIIDGNDIYLQYYLPNGAITTDTTLVVNNGNFGFSISGTTISSVAIVGRDTIKITCAGSPSGQTLNYNRNQISSYHMDYPNFKGKFRGGNIRDKQGDTLKFGTFPLHNWAVAQIINL